MKTRTRMLAGALAVALTTAGGAALSQGGPPAGDRGPGMMNGAPAAAGAYGPGMMGGGYGPGAARGGYGPGMMGGGYGYGPGTMGGANGYGPGMMGGYGRGGGFAMLDLSDDQRSTLATLREETRAKTWDTMGQLRAEQFKLREMMRGDSVDANAAVEQQRKVDDLRRQMMKAQLEMRNRMVAMLTPEQKKRLREGGPWWYDDAAE